MRHITVDRKVDGKSKWTVILWGTPFGSKTQIRNLESGMWYPAKVEFLQTTLIVKHVIFSISNWRQRTLHDVNNLFVSMDPIAPARSFVNVLLDPGSSSRSVPPCWKRFPYFFTVGRSSASGAIHWLDFDLSISAALSSLTIKKQILAHCATWFRSVSLYV
jgi:hypothetical protein